jgi:hypothetical protein
MGPYDEYHDSQTTELNVAIRTTLVFVAIGRAHTLLAHLCDVILPPKPYYICASIVSIQALRASPGGCGAIARRSETSS